MEVAAHRDDGVSAGAGAPVPLVAPPAGPVPVNECDLLIVGAGPAGLPRPPPPPVPG